MRSSLVFSLLVIVLLMFACDNDEFVPRCDEYNPGDLTINFSGFEDYVGYDLYLRVTETRNWNPPDPGPWVETFRADITIPAGDFSLHEPGGVTSCLAVHVDFFVDLNDNGVYEAPPMDHSWRLYAHPWEDETEVELKFRFNVPPDSCKFHQNGTQLFCDYLDIEWPADRG